jgi:hypothetical protein
MCHSHLRLNRSIRSSSKGGLKQKLTKAAKASKAAMAKAFHVGLQKRFVSWPQQQFVIYKLCANCVKGLSIFVESS